MTKLATSILCLLVAAVAVPATMAIAHPMMRRIAQSGPGDPDFFWPGLIIKCGWMLALGGYFVGMIFAFLFARSLADDRSRALTAFITALVLVGIPYLMIVSAGSWSTGGSANFLPYVILFASGLLASPFLIWSLVCIWPDRGDSY